jgi:hypothetical protein
MGKGDDALARIEWRLTLLVGVAIRILEREIQMAGELQGLTDEVAATRGVQQSAIVLLSGLKTALDAAIASGNLAALADLSAQLGTSREGLAAAVAANSLA